MSNDTQTFLITALQTLTSKSLISKGTVEHHGRFNQGACSDGVNNFIDTRSLV